MIAAWMLYCQPLVPAFRASKWSSSGCAAAAGKGVVVYWKVLKQ